MSTRKIESFKTPADVPPVVFFSGKEEYLIERYTAELLQIVVPAEVRDFNLDILYCPDTKVTQVLEIARAFPMMAEKRAVVLKDIQKMPAAELAALSKYVAQPNPSTCLILIDRAADSRQKSLQALQSKTLYIPCNRMYENRAAPWLQQEFKARGRKIHPEALSLLITQVGTNLRDLVNEIDKLVLFVPPEAEISAADVARAAGFRKDFTLYSLQNALGERNINETLDIYERIRLGTSAQAILFQLGKHFANLLVATGYKPGAQDSVLARITKTHAYFLKNLHRHKRNYAVRELENALENIRHADYVLKTFPVQEAMLMQQLFIHIVKGFPAARLPFAGKNM